MKQKRIPKVYAINALRFIARFEAKQKWEAKKANNKLYAIYVFFVLKCCLLQNN